MRLPQQRVQMLVLEVIRSADTDNNRRSRFRPGRTQEINLFLINNSFYLVDLPGYGFTKVSKALREKLEKLIKYP